MEARQSLNVGTIRLVELSHAADEVVGLDGVLITKFGGLATSDLDFGLPLVAFVLPAGFLNLRIESNMAVEAPFLGNGYEILMNLFLPRVLSGPVWVWLERQRVKVAPY